jgi:hypothetical protein
MRQCCFFYLRRSSGGLQLIGIVVLGEYLGLTYIEAKGDLSTSSCGISIHPASESCDPYLTVATAHDDI